MTDKRTEPCTDARELAKKIQGIYHQGVYEDETSKIAALIQSAFDKIRREDVAKGKAEWFRDTKTISWSRIERAILSTVPVQDIPKCTKPAETECHAHSGDKCYNLFQCEPAQDERKEP